MPSARAVFTVIAATLLVLVGFSAVAEPSAATEATVAWTVTGAESASGGNGITATEEFGQDTVGLATDRPLVLDIADAGGTATLTAMVEIIANRLLDAGFAIIVQYSTHDALGRRVRVEGATSSTWTATIQVGDTVVFERDQSEHTTKYVYAAGMRVARTDCVPVPGPDPLLCTPQYYLTDHLGSTRKVVATPDPPSPPAVTFSAEYAPFGEAYNVAGSERFRFTGEAHDDPTGFTHLRARQYDPETGRFTGADPILGSLSHPQTQNRYAYVSNGPTGTTDPSGMCELICLTVILLGALLVAGVATAALAQVVPELRPAADAFATVFGFIPLYGDVFSTAYFLTQDAFECQTGGCDWGAIALDAVGIVPGIPNLGGGVHALKALGGIGGIALTARTVGRADDAADAARSWAFVSKADALNFVRHSDEFSDAARNTASRFFGGATSKSTGFRIFELPGGGHKLQFMSWSRNTPLGPFGKKFVGHVGPGGDLLAEYRYSLLADGALKWTWTHGYVR